MSTLSTPTMRDGEPMVEPKILLAIPAYNCAPQIGRVLDAIDGHLLEHLTRIAVIDNGSSDGTVEAALSAGRRFGPKFEVWRNRDNYGLGGTHKVAFGYAVEHDFDYVAVVHGDDQASTPELRDLIRLAEERPTADAVLGSRFARGARLRGYSKVRTYGNRAINLAFTIVSRRRTTDLGSGLNLFRVAPLRSGAYLDFDDRITFNIDLLLHYFRTNANLIQAPITWSETDQVSNARNFAVGRTAVEKLLRWWVGRPQYSRDHVAYRYEVVA